MAYNPIQLGQATKANSSPVVLASDSDALSVSSATLATAARQDTGNTSIASVDTKTPALGQALAAASSPVVLTAAQVTALTPPAPIAGFATDAKQDILLTELQLKADLSETQPVSLLALPSVHFQDISITGQGSQTALNNNVVLAVAGTGSTDLLNGTTGISFRSVAFQVVPAAGTVTAGIITFEGSNDNTNFVSVFLSDRANITATPVATVTIAASTNRFFMGAIPFRYFRARISTGITGTTTGVQAFTIFSPVPFSDARLAVTNTSAGNFLAQVNVTSGGIASGAIASGAIASGAIAIGAFTAGATSIAENEDVAHATGDRGLKVWAVSNEANTARAADGDYLPLATDTEGNMRTVGNRDHDAIDAGEPIKVGGRATNVEIAAVANGDRSDLLTTLTGKLITHPWTNPENIVRGVTAAMTGTTTTSVIAAPAAGLRNYITAVTVGNSHATVGTFVNLQDGSGGTTIWTIPAASVFGGATISFSPPLRQPTTATALFCACVTTGSNTIVAANGYIAA